MSNMTSDSNDPIKNTKKLAKIKERSKQWNNEPIGTKNAPINPSNPTKNTLESDAPSPSPSNEKPLESEDNSQSNTEDSANIPPISPDPFPALPSNPEIEDEPPNENPSGDADLKTKQIEQNETIKPPTKKANTKHFARNPSSAPKSPSSSTKTENTEESTKEIEDDAENEVNLEGVDQELYDLKNQILKDEGANITNVKHKRDETTKNQRFQRDEEQFINIDLKVGDKIQTFRVRPAKDKIFAFICLGYDKALKQPCYRYLKDYTYNQIFGFKEFIEKYGCICGDKSNHAITITPFLDDLFERTLATPKEYPQKFIMFYLQKFKFGTLVGAYSEQKEVETIKLNDNTEEEKSNKKSP